MNKWVKLANYLLDMECERSSPNEVMKMLFDDGFDADFLIELGFEISQVEKLK